MQKTVKKIIFKIFGLKIYLKILHSAFFICYDLKLIKNNPAFKYHYFVKDFIIKGDYIIDIGANLGYFTKIFARATGKNGKVIAIEPVKPFFDTLKWGLRHYNNCTFYNNALGLENKPIQLSVPKKYGYFRTGLAHISDKPLKKNENYIFNCQMVKGSELLKDINRIDYIKCDIEGYEIFVIPELHTIFEKFKPVLQIEINDNQNLLIIQNFMQKLGYMKFYLHKNKLYPENIKNETGDFIFIHKDKIDNISDKFKIPD